ncbi:YceD family protein [Frigoribacterium sp. 2-23]|uniref:YceD family protein n=1 Tax=Frigoribacterium sp. 2-23 TaxID=3415006 RepID=UPI003C6FEB29
MPHFTKTPYTVAVHDLMHRPGEMREHDLETVVPERLGEGPISVPAGATIDIDLRLEGLHDGILASAHVSGLAIGECSRCLKPIEQSVEVDFAELFAYSDDEAFDYKVQDDHVDLEPVVRDAVVLSLPFQPVCRPDCPGLDPVTGERVEDIPDYQPRENIDPRWSALATLTVDESGEAGADDASGSAESASAEPASHQTEDEAGAR